MKRFLAVPILAATLWIQAFAPPVLAAPAPARRPLSQKDFAAWCSISSTNLSHDGRILACAYMPQEGDGNLVVRDLKRGQAWHHGAGALPPQPSIRIAFSSDGRYVVATAYPSKADTDKARKARKKPEETSKGGLLVVAPPAAKRCAWRT